MNLVISDEKYAKSLFPLQADNDIIILKQLKRSRFECSCLSLTKKTQILMARYSSKSQYFNYSVDVT